MSFLSRRRLGSVSFKKWFHIWYPVLWTSSLSITSRPWHVHILIRLHRDTSTPPHFHTRTRPHQDTSTLTTTPLTHVYSITPPPHDMSTSSWPFIAWPFLHQHRPSSSFITLYRHTLQSVPKLVQPLTHFHCFSKLVLITNSR
jgi:hypothetical protein